MPALTGESLAGSLTEGGMFHCEAVSALNIFGLNKVVQS